MAMDMEQCPQCGMQRVANGGDQADQADQGDEAEPTAEPIEPADDENQGQPQKASQAQANYREGNPQRSCGLCANFDSKDHGCDVVEGSISPFGFCDYYARQDNPFRQGQQANFTGVRIAAVPTPAGPQPVAATVTRGTLPTGRLRIGGKTYQ